MDREEIKAKIIACFKQQAQEAVSSPDKMQQFQMSTLYHLFDLRTLPPWGKNNVYSIVREITHELINAGFLYPGTSGDMNSGYPWLTITEYGKEAFLSEDWLPYDPDGYIRALKEKIPNIDDVTLSYIGESVAAYNQRHLLSATITLGVASENLMLLLIEAYIAYIKDPRRKTKLQNKTKSRFISAQYQAFKEYFIVDVRLFPQEIQANWETYLDGVFNFIRINRNDAGHPTGKRLDAKIVYANLQIFSEYAQFIFKLISLLR